MKKKLLSLLLVVMMVMTSLPATAFAAGAGQGEGVTGETCEVTVNFDISSLGTDEALSTLSFAKIPSGKVTVPKGSTLEAALDKLDKESADLTFVKANNMITKVNQVTGKTDDNSFDTMLQNFGVEAVPTEFQYAGWMYSGEGLPGMGINSDKIEKNTTVNFRYTLYFGAASNTEWKNFDWEFVDAYKALKAKVAEATSLDMSGYTQDEQAKVNAAKDAATSLLTTIDTDSASGIWAAYIATKTTTLWGPDSVTDQLQKSAKAITNAIAKVPAPTEVQVTGETSDGKQLTFASKETVAPGTKVQLNAKVLPEGANQEVTFDKLMGDGVSVSPTGLVTCDVECSMAMIQVKSKEDPSKSKNVNIGFEIPKYAVTFKGSDKVTLSKGCITLKQGEKKFSGTYSSRNNTIKFDLPTGEYDYEVKVGAFSEKGKVLVTDKAFDIVFADGQGQRAEALMDNIAKSYVENSTEWIVMEMAAYLKYKPDTANKTSDKAKQNFINKAIKTLSTSTSDTALDKAIIGLRGLSGDITKLYPVNANTPINAIDKLNAITHSSSAWSAPYTMAAYNQGVPNKEKEDALIAEVLKNQKEDGSWDEWGTIDTTANVIAGLSFYKDKQEVQTAIDKAVTYLASQQKPNGAYDGGYGVNSNSTAMVIVGLAAAGVNPETDARFIKNGNSVLDGLMTFALADNSGFGYTNNTQLNPSGTEQSFRALIAAANVMKTGAAYNIYDFSGNAKQPLRATGDGVVDKPAEPQGENITVKMTIKSDKDYWLNNATVTIPGKGAMVYHAFVKACQDAGITYEGAETGYVRSITKGNVTLKEFDKGPNSGWLYKVNGELPQVGLTSHAIANGDDIVWYYTEDWKKDPQAGQMAEDPNKKPVTQDIAGVAGGAGGAGGAGNVVDAKVPAATLDKLVADANKNKANSIELNVKGADKADKVSVEIPKDAVLNVANKTDADLKVNTPAGSVTLDRAAMTEAASKATGADLTVVVEKKAATDKQKKKFGEDVVFSNVDLLSGGAKVKSLGSATVRVSLPITDKVANQKSAVAIIGKKGKLTKVAGKVVVEKDKKFFQFETSTFGKFVLAEEAKIDGIVAAQVKREEVKLIKTELKTVKAKAPVVKNVKNKVVVKIKLNKSQKATVKKFESMGYDVKYKFYRSKYKNKKFKGVAVSDKARYVGKATKGKYFYKTRILVYDKDGKLVAKSGLR